MLSLASLSRRELGQRLAGPGLDLGTGGFITRLSSPIASVADGLHLLYGDYPVHPDGQFADFHVSLMPSPGLRRWYKPQVNFCYDGHPVFRPLPLDHAFPMFEWGLNWCVSAHANNHLIVHAAVLEKDGLAVILPAPPGSGKSTLCATLAHRGWRLLSDELALLRLADGLVAPLPRPISLKNSSIDIMRDYLTVPGQSAPVFSRPVSETSKGTVAHLKAPSAAVARAGELARPAWVIFPKWEAGSEAVLTPMPKARAFTGVASNAFNYSLTAAPGFELLGRTIDQCDCYGFRYSRMDEAVALFSRLSSGLAPPAA